MPEVTIGPCIRCGHGAHIMDGLDFGDGLINVYQNCHNTECKLYMVNKRVGCKCKEINHKQVSTSGNICLTHKHKKEDRMEQETKFRVKNWQVLRRMMLEVNAQRLSERHFEDNFMLDYDRDGNSSTPLRNAGQTLRIRTVPGATVLTFKGPAKVVGKTKVREEIECVVHPGINLFKIFKKLGYTPRFRYQKYREEFALGGAVIALDDTPIGFFIEIEGTLKAITKAAKELHLNMKDGISDSYPKLYDKAREKKPDLPDSMLFINT